MGHSVCGLSQGLLSGFSSPPDWWMLKAYFWHLSHFLTYSYEPFCMLGHQYPYVKALWESDMPPVWLPQIFSCNSSNNISTVSGWTHNKYGPEYERLYSFWTSESQNLGAFLRTFSALTQSSGKIPFFKNATNGFC